MIIITNTGVVVRYPAAISTRDRNFLSVSSSKSQPSEVDAVVNLDHVACVVPDHAEIERPAALTGLVGTPPESNQ